MAIHPELPESPYAILNPAHRWFPADEELREKSYEKLLPPLVAKVRVEVQAWRDAGYAGATDVRFISTYAPYCDAMVVDTVMHHLATDPLIDLPGRFGTKFFSRSNWQDFLIYLDTVGRNRTPELTKALEWVHPPNAKEPDWSGILKKFR